MKVHFNANPVPVEKFKTFSFKKKEWPDEDNKLKMKLEGATGISFSEYMRVLSGKEHPELFLLWLQDFRTKIWNNAILTGSKKLEILMRLVDKEAATVVARTIVKCEGNTVGGIPQRHTYAFTNWTIRNRLETMTTDQQWKDYITPNGDHCDDMITECIHALKFEIYGVDMASKQCYYKLRRQMRALKINFTDGVRKWAQRIEDYQTYLPDMLWESGEENGHTMQRFGEIDMREILDQAMTKLHVAQLNHVDWQHYERPFAETVAKLESLEPLIIKSAEHEKRLAALEDGKKTTTRDTSRTTKQGKSKGSKQSDKDSSIGYRKCETCGKMHKGVCWKLSGDGPPSTSTNHANADKDRKRKWKKEMISMVKEIMEHKDDNFESSDDEESWKKLTKNSVERAYVLGAAQADQNCDDSDISVDDSTAKQYLKRYRKSTKKRRRKGN
jgi:hypothetical protein